jgi:hypothetical protein
MIDGDFIGRIIQDTIHHIENSTEDEIKTGILENAGNHDKTITDGDYNSLLEYLKISDWRTPVYTEYMCNCEYRKARAVFQKILKAFHIDSVCIDRELKYIIENATYPHTGYVLLDLKGCKLYR